MIEDFVLRALLAGVGVAVIAGALGCFIVWKRMAYFGDSLAHSALLGIALGVFFGISIGLGIAAVCTVFAVLLTLSQHQRTLATDTLLGILAHAMLGLGLLIISFVESANADLHSYLFGDILTVTWSHLYWIWGGAAVGLILLHRYWGALCLTTIDEDLAQAEGIKVWRMRLLLIILMIIVVSIAIRVIGVLLITSLLIIPAATARQLARSPSAMAAAAAALGSVAVIAGVFASVRWDTPTSPAIVSAATILFAGGALGTVVRNRNRNRFQT